MSMMQMLLGGVLAQATTWNPADIASGLVASNGNRTLTNTNTTGSQQSGRSLISKSSGQWYAEFAASGDSNVSVGVGTSSAALTQYPGGNASSTGINYGTGNVFNSGSGFTGVSGLAVGDIVTIEVDFAGSVYFRKNGAARVGPFTRPTGTLFLMGSCSPNSADTIILTGTPIYPATAGYLLWA